MPAVHGRCKIDGRTRLKEDLRVAMRDSDTPIPYCLLRYPDITPLEVSEERPVGSGGALMRYAGVYSGSVQVAGEVASGIRSAFPSRFNRFRVPGLPPPDFKLPGESGGPPIPD